MKRMLALPVMMAALGVYVVLHSPIRSAVARLFGRPGEIEYFSDRSLFPQMTWDAAAAVFFVVAALLAAASITRRSGVRSYERPIVFGISAFALISVSAAYVGGLAAWIGAHLLRPPWGPLLAAIPALIVVGHAVYGGWRPSLRFRPSAPDGLVFPLTVLAATLLAVFAAISFSLPPTGFDALGFHAPMALYFWRDGDLISLLDRAPRGFALAFSGAGELWMGLLSLAGGERLANLSQLPFAMLGSAAIYAFSRALGCGARAARLGSVGFLLAPIVIVQAGVQVPDLIAAALVMSAAALACPPAHRWTSRRFAATGVALGLAVTAKIAALPAVVAIVCFVAVTTVVSHRPSWRPAAAAGLVFAMAFAVTVAPWWTRNAVRYGNPIFPAAIPFVGRGVVVADFAQKDDRFVPSRAAWPLYPLLESHSDASGFGALFAVAILPGLAAARRRGRRPLVLYGVVAAVSLPAWWVLTQHEPRHLLAVFGLGFAFIPWSLIAVPRRLRTAGAITLVVAAVFSALVTIDQALLPRLRHPADRAEFYDQIWGVDRAVASRPESEPILYHTGFANLSYAGDYALLGPSLGRTLLTVDGPAQTADIAGLMQRHGVTLAYVPASEAARPTVEAMYASRLFSLERESTVSTGALAGTHRYLYRLRPRETTLAHLVTR